MAPPKFFPIAYFRGDFVPFAKAQLSIATHGLHYGTAALGGLRVYPLAAEPGTVAFFRLDRHCQRLSDSARFLHYDLCPQTLANTLVDLVRRNQIQQPGYVRPLVYTSELGIAPRLHDLEKDLAIYAMALDDYLPTHGVRCRFSSWCRQEDRAMPLRGKLTAAYLTSSLAKTEAHQSGFDEAILLTANGKVSEGSASNLFLVRRGQLITPSIDQDNLEGITRDTVLQLAQDLGIPTVERTVDKSELLIADEAFLTGTAAKITAITAIEGYTLPSHRPMTEQLQQQLTRVMTGQEARYRHWLTPVAVVDAPSAESGMPSTKTRAVTP